jgi:mono/diheme cytochrome c family protein
MRITQFAPKYFVTALFAAGLGIWLWQTFTPKATGAGHTVAVKVPELSPLAAQGKTAFDANCVSCHGVNAAGTDKGPPLVHNIYNPGHHSDEAFYFAAKQGSRSHHWRYGDMPPQPRVSDNQIAAIVRYVRELQRANGIGFQPHKM